jgi:hypothetical protein
MNTACCVLYLLMVSCFLVISRSQLQRGLRRGFAAARLLWLWFRIPPGAWSFFSFECCVLSGKGLCDGLITCLQELCRVCCVQWVWSRSPPRGHHEPESGQSAKEIKSPNNKEWSLPSKKLFYLHTFEKVCLLWGRIWFYVIFTQFVIAWVSVGYTNI